MQESKAGLHAADPESVWSAMVRVYDTGQKLVLERIELAKLELIAFARVELAESAAHLVRSLVLGVAGGILLVAGWFVLTWGLVSLTANALSMPARLLIEAGVNLAVGAVLVLWAARKKEARIPS